jgi:4-diphosphocytidyl-2-C-methyl-D-erythritol kinase
MIAFPPSKINLGLHILGKRTDGYHTLETCFYPVPWTDILEVIPSGTLHFTSSGNTIPGNPEDNLCLKAYRILAKDFNLPAVSIHLHKQIPTGAGLGGGSSDGAHSLRLLNEIFELGLSTEKLMAYAASLGSDCAFFIQDKPMFGYGRGEVLQEATVNLTGKFLLLVKPDVHISTAEAYAGVTPRQPATALKNIFEQHPLPSWKSILKNDFEESVFKQHAVLRRIKKMLYNHGAVYASMSGSGSSLFGIFDQPVDINSFEEWTTWSGRLT